MARLTVLFTALAVTLAACTTTPVTGRKQLILISDSEANALGVQSYQQIKQQLPVSQDTEKARTVERVGRRIAAVVAAERDFDWEFTLFEDDTPNAFALPGGKIGVNTGLFKVAETEEQLAAVMAHEVAHAVARHSAERLSRDVLMQSGIGILGATTGSPDLVQLSSAVATLGVTLPFTRSQEAEADEIGLIYMARAGYDPRAAVDLWRNFAEFGGKRPPEFLSTHPSPGNRIERLQRAMPQALEIYRASGAAPS